MVSRWGVVEEEETKREREREKERLCQDLVDNSSNYIKRTLQYKRKNTANDFGDDDDAAWICGPRCFCCYYLCVVCIII